MGRILASVCHGDLSLIKQLIEDDDIDEFVRSACFHSLITLYVEGELERKTILEYLKSLFHGKLSRKNHYIWASLVVTCNDIYATSLMDEIRIAFDEKLLLEDVIDLDYIAKTFSRNEDEVLSELYWEHGVIFLQILLRNYKAGQALNRSNLNQKKLIALRK